MTFDLALRATEMLLGLALIQQSAEHAASFADERRLFVPRLVLAALLLLGIRPEWTAPALMVLGALILRRFRGAYNGGSDRMGLLVLACLCLAHLLPGEASRQLALGYLAVQLTLSYAVSGWVKIVNPEWRTGRALQDVFRFSAYPVSEHTRRWADRPRLLLGMSWSVMLFELLFPLCLLSTATLVAGLAVAACFHLANACLFGLNRFLWTWLSAYPSLLWLQERFIPAGTS